MVENRQKWNHFTSIYGKRSAVLDYILTPYDSYDFCKYLYVYSMNEISDKLNLEPLITTQ